MLKAAVAGVGALSFLAVFLVMGLPASGGPKLNPFAMFLLGAGFGICVTAVVQAMRSRSAEAGSGASGARKV